MNARFALPGALRFVLCLLAMLLALPAAQAADSSMPSFSAPDLLIPRIDVESYGALKVTLTLVDAQAMIFELAGATSAGAATTPGATYDAATGIVNIPVLRAG